MKYFSDESYIRKKLQAESTKKVRITSIPLTIGKDKKNQKILVVITLTVYNDCG